MTRVIILGATGPTGIYTAKEFLTAYPEGTAVLYIRNPSKVPSELSSNPRISVVKGELNDAEAFAAVFKSGGQVDAVLSAIGPIFPATRGKKPITDIYRTIVPIIAANTKRFIALSTISFKDPRDKFALLPQLVVTLVWLVARAIWEDVVTFSPLVVEEADKHDLDWTLIRVPILNNKEGQKTVTGYQGDGKVGVNASRINIAKLFVESIESKEWVRKSPAISSY